MQLGYIGLGKMGANMVERLLEKKHKVSVFDLNERAVLRVAAKGAKPSNDLGSLVSSLKAPRLVWVMVPHQFTEGVIKDLSKHLKKGDTIIDGGNSPFKQSIKIYKRLEKKGIHFLDAGVSGGPGGARNGACIMVGGKKARYTKYEKLFKDLCVPSGYGYMGSTGAGHFVKMVHNGIEYGMMQAMAEGFDLMKNNKVFDLDLKEISRVYNHGSVIESSLMRWMMNGFKKFGLSLRGVTNRAGGLGEGRWTVDFAKEKKIRVKVLEEAVKARRYSSKIPNYQAQVIMTLRNQFGGHSVKGNKKDYL